MKRKGWVVWIWGKMGGLLVFFGMMMVLLVAYSYITASVQAEGANQLSRALRDIILDTYNAPEGLGFEYQLPDTIEGRRYDLEVYNLTGDMVGIIARTDTRFMQLIGGASAALRLSDNSFRTVKARNETDVYLCIIKHQGRVYIEKSKCS